jgi:hypothetical protein
MRLDPHQVASLWVDVMAASVRQSTRCVKPLAFPRDVGVAGLVVVQFLGDEPERRVDGGRAACRVGLGGGLRDLALRVSGRVREVLPVASGR